MPGWAGQVERQYLVRAAAFEPAPRIDLSSEGVGAWRWWTVAELRAADAIFAPRRLPALLADLLDRGPPPAPVDVGV
jgi:hypothetical protein